MGKDRDRRPSRPDGEAVVEPTATTEATEAKVEAGPALDVEAKIKQIEESKLSPEEKKAYVARLRGDVDDPMAAHRVPFSVYANIKKIRHHVRSGMLQYPPAKGVQSATVVEWDTIFKDF